MIIATGSFDHVTCGYETQIVWHGLGPRAVFLGIPCQKGWTSRRICVGMEFGVCFRGHCMLLECIIECRGICSHIRGPSGSGLVSSWHCKRVQVGLPEAPQAWQRGSAVSAPIRIRVERWLPVSMGR